MNKKNLKALMEKRSALITELDNMVNGLEDDKGEVRAFTNEEMQAYNDKKAQAEALTASIKAIQETRAEEINVPADNSPAAGDAEPPMNTACLRNTCAARLLRSEQARTGQRLTTALSFRPPSSTRSSTR